MPLPRFVLLTAIGSGVWNAAFLAAGWWLGARWEEVESWSGPASYVVVALLVLGLVVLAAPRRRSSAPER
jgi:membrane protein DedA with SNARE-associated domain